MGVDKLIKVTYQYMEFPAGELQQKLDCAFDLLFEYMMDGRAGVSASAFEAKKGVAGYVKN